jgi:hypothetical protein
VSTLVLKLDRTFFVDPSGDLGASLVDRMISCIMFLSLFLPTAHLILLHCVRFQLCTTPKLLGRCMAAARQRFSQP